MRKVVACLLAASCFCGAVVVDRIAVVIDRQLIKTSDVAQDLRVTDFLNRQPVDLSATSRRKAAARLVDQQLIRKELSAQGYSRPSQADADGLLAQIVRDRFHGSDVELKSALQQYGLTRDVLREHLLWQLTVLRFIDQRFRPGVLVTDEEIQTYYNSHLNEFKRDYPKDFSLATLSATIRTSLEAPRVDQEFESWLDETRKQSRVEYKEAAFQ